ncbi:hemolysin D [Solibacillus sp. R5-41]|uniref:PAQR family membrane homeostasis protein TrhA n=1 Tax=Solibacillus sp. R5-41 TaxID=2048654 RepID=UPI000C124A6D|nr:hemolysin III family protein [Solibacillus sp. R5-41]ATP40095.1 hemolysin D [Solibacillus sp. R5-41]
MQHEYAIDYKNVKEELWNAITHGFGFILSIPACVLLIIYAAQHGTAMHIVSYSIFGTTLILLFLMSTLLHSVPLRYKRIFAILDHSCIYLLIAGTYTPFLLIAIGGTLGFVLLCIIWGLAIFGVVFKFLFIHRFERVSLLLYLVMGWLIIFAVKPIYAYLQWDGFLLLLAGGLFFTFGAIFYAWTRLPYNHAIWHLFVIMGCGCMVSCIYFFM